MPDVCASAATMLTSDVRSSTDVFTSLDICISSPESGTQIGVCVTASRIFTLIISLLQGLWFAKACLISSVRKASSFFKSAVSCLMSCFAESKMEFNWIAHEANSLYKSEVSAQISVFAALKTESISFVPEVNSCLKSLISFWSNSNFWDMLSNLSFNCVISFSKELN